MNVTDMILVTENRKGSETNSLMDLLDFIDFAVKESWLSLKELAEDMATLGITCGEKKSGWRVVLRRTRHFLQGTVQMKSNWKHFCRAATTRIRNGNLMNRDVPKIALTA